MTTNIELRVMICYECGIHFGVPESLARYRIRDEEIEIEESESIHCPNGHENRYVRKQKDFDGAMLKKQNDSMRDELVQVKHLADQLQAKLEQQENAKIKEKDTKTNKAFKTGKRTLTNILSGY